MTLKQTTKMRELFVIGVLLIIKANGQCQFPSPFADSTWLDSTRGTITFGTTTMTGWSVTVLNQARSSWECVDSSDSTTLIMKATQSVLYSSNVNIFIFMCMKLTQISTNSYSYKLQQSPQVNAGYERLWFSSDSSLTTVSTICDTSASIPTLEFHVLVKQGMADSAAITFPDNLLFSADYKYMTNTGTVACNGTADTMDMCSDTTALSFNNYTNCKQEIAYSAGGELWCVAKASLGSYDCAVVYNRDETISGTASQFACLCSDGSSVSVVSGNCTSDQRASSYPTAADGTTVIGYLLTIESVYVNCAPQSSDSNLVVIIVVVVVLLVVIIAVVVVSIILYKRGHCVTICQRLDGCLGKTPCWPFCRSKVCVCCADKTERTESAKPILINGTSAHADTINETSKSKLTRDKTSMSAISRSSTMALNRERSDLEKSMQRQTTATSIGIDLKSERSSVHQIKVKSQDGEKEPRLKLLGINLSFLVCCPEKKDEVKSVKLVEPEEEKPSYPGKKVAKGGAKKGGNKATKGGGKEGKGKGGKGKKKGGKGKDKDGEGEDIVVNGKVGKDEETLAENGEALPVKEKADKGGKKSKNKAKVQPKNSPREGDVTLTDIENKIFPENEALTRAPTKLKSDLRLTSTPVPGGEKGQKGVVSVPAGLLKPQDKPTDWTFLSCCFGNRKPPTTEEKETEEPTIPVQQEKGKGKPAAKGKGGAQKKGAAATGKKAGKKGGGGGGGKGGGKKKDVNENDLEIDDIQDEPKPVERAKTMPEREKTALSLKDAEHVKVAVYVPTDKTNLQLKDTVINGPPKLEKSKTDAGLVRPPSSRPASSVKKDKKKAGKKGNKKAEKGKDGGKKDKKKKSKK